MTPPCGPAEHELGLPDQTQKEQIDGSCRAWSDGGGLGVSGVSGEFGPGQEAEHRAIEWDPREEWNLLIENSWVLGPYMKVIEDYHETLKGHPNPPAPNFTDY